MSVVVRVCDTSFRENNYGLASLCPHECQPDTPRVYLHEVREGENSPGDNTRHIPIYLTPLVHPTRGRLVCRFPVGLSFTW